MTHPQTAGASRSGAALRPAGFLLSPFGWAAEPLLALVRSSPMLAGELPHLSFIRMHLIALGLSHVDGTAFPHIGPILLRARAEDVLDATLGYRPAGLKRALRTMGPQVLKAENYRRLVRFLDDRRTAKLLHHARAVDDAMIETIHNVPDPLREPILKMSQQQERIGGLEFMREALHHLVRLGAAADFDSLIAAFGSVRQPQQLTAAITDIVEALPLPDIQPPHRIGHACRLDRAVDLRALARRWHNCLENYICKHEACNSFIYFWKDGAREAACQARVFGRLGWTRDEIKGPRNAEPAPDLLADIEQAFTTAGVPPTRVVRPLFNILEAEEYRELIGDRRHRRRPRRRPPHALDDLTALA